MGEINRRDYRELHKESEGVGSMISSQKKILAFIKKFITENKYPPSTREIGEGVGLRSTSTINTHMKKLRELGYIGYVDNQSRALWVTERGEMHE